MKLTDFPMLFVGDDPEEILRVQHCLAQANLVNPLRILRDAQKAMDYLSGHEEYADRESHPFPSLVFLDLSHSQPSGPAMLAWIRSQKNLTELPVILLSSSTGDPGDSGLSTKLDVPHLAKPVECEPLLETVRSIGMYWMILDSSRAETGGHDGFPANSRVLVVDRDADFLRGITEALRRRVPPIVVDTALDAAAALRRLGRGSLDALVYEREIEESEEFGFLREARARVSDGELAIFILCTEPDVAFTLRAIQNGVTGVLLKLVRRDHFSDQLHSRLVAARKPQDTAAPAASGAKRAQDTTVVLAQGPNRKGRSSARPSRARTPKT